MLKIWIIPFGFMGFLQYFVTSAFPKAMVEDIWTFLGNKHLFLIEMNETDMSLFPFEYARAMDLSDFHPLWKSDYFEKDLIIFKTCPDVPLKGGTLLRKNWILMPSKCSTLLWSDLDLMSRIISYEECSNGTWALLEHYAIKMTNYINPMGKWSPTEGLEIPQPQIWERRANLHGHVLRATALEWIWFAFPVFDMQGSLVDYTGLGPTILKELAKALNFQVTFEEPPDCTWQGTHPNGSSYGMFGFLVRKEVDITGSPMVIVPERQEQIDFTLRIHAFKQDLVSAHAPEGTRVNFWVYFDAFTFSAWISLLICGFILSLVLFLCGLALQEGIGLSSAFRIVLGNGTIQVSHVTLKQLHLIITLGTSFILMAYNGNLTSTMTVQLNPPPIDSLEKVVAGNAKLLMWVDTIHTIMLSKAPPGDFKHKLWQHILKGSDQPLVNDSEVLLSRLEEDPLTYYLGSALDIGNGSENLLVVPLENEAALNIGFGLQKDSEFKDLFDYHLHRMEEMGLMRLWKQKFDTNRRSSHKVIESRFYVQALGFENVIFPFLVATTGIVMSLLLAGIERLGVTLKRVMIS